MTKTLTEEQQKQYFAENTNKPNPLSPLDWLAKQSAPAAAPAAMAPKADPVIAGSSVRRYPGKTPAASSSYDSAAAAAFGKGGALDRNAPNESNIRAEAQKRVQAQIDAISNTYTGILAQTKQEGENRSGQTRAVNARSGTLGQDFGNAAAEKTQQYNTEQYNTVLAERDNKIAAILGAADERATAQIEAQKNRAATNSAAYITYLKGVSDQAKTDFNDYFKAGGSLDQLSDDQYKKFLDQTGYSPEQAHALSVINKPQEKVLTSFTQGNKYYVVTQDPITGERKTESLDLGFDVPVNYKEQKLDDGTMIFYPENIDPSKPIKDQILTYGVQSQSYKLEVAQKQAQLQKTYAEIDKLKKDGVEETDVVADLKGAAAAVAAGADANAVRQRFLESHPAKASLYNNYFGTNSTFLLMGQQ